MTEHEVHEALTRFREHDFRIAAEAIDEIAEYPFENEPHLAIELSDALMALLPVDVVGRHMPTVWAKRNQVDF